MPSDKTNSSFSNQNRTPEINLEPISFDILTPLHSVVLGLARLLDDTGETVPLCLTKVST